MNTIFHISLALLQDSKKAGNFCFLTKMIFFHIFIPFIFQELLQADFEGILKFFRVNLPRKYRTEGNAKELIHAAVKLKVSSYYSKKTFSLPFQIFLLKGKLKDYKKWGFLILLPSCK